MHVYTMISVYIYIYVCYLYILYIYVLYIYIFKINTYYKYIHKFIMDILKEIENKNVYVLIE